MAKWRDSGRWLRAAARNVFCRAVQGTGPTILLLHGYPSSSLTTSWVRLWDKLRPDRCSLSEQADIAQTVDAECTTGALVIIANDMRTS